MPTDSTPSTRQNQNARYSWFDAIHEFLIHVEATRAQKTLRFYDVQLRQLALWADANAVDFTTFGKRHMDRYLVERAKTVSPTTMRHDAVCAKAFFKWCARNELIDRSFLTDYEIRRAPRPSRHMPTDEEVSTLLIALRDFWNPDKNPDVRYCPAFKRQFHRDRNRAIILGLLDSACRIGEMLSVKVDDLDMKRCQFVIRESKGREPRTVPVSADWVEIVQDWMKARKRLMMNAEGGEDEGWLFVSEFGTRIDESKFLKSMKRYVRYGGMNEEITLHSLRRYSLNKLAKTNLLVTQQIAGHKDPKTTLLYTKLDADYVREVHGGVGIVKGILSGKRNGPPKKRLL